ncbi:MAG: STAS domain-containing protein [Clostridiales bacterium]|nr:STAS domain-containing protein [Clostridiales bacterium]
MEIIKTVEDSKLAVAVKGRLDTTTAPELEEALNAALEGVTELELDFAELEYISSAGLRVLLATQKKMQERGAMTVTGVNDIVMEVFEVTGFCDILNIV